METPLQLNSRDIVQLDYIQLHRLIKKIAFCEANRLDLPLGAIRISDNQMAPDGGIDGRFHMEIIWDGDIHAMEHNFIPDTNCGYQFKAKPLEINDYKKELIKEGKLKKRIYDLLKNNGTYVLITNKSTLNPQELDKRLSIMRSVLPAELSTANLKIFDSESLCTYANDYPECVTYVKECLGQSTGGFKLLSSYFTEEPEKYILDSNREAITASILKIASKEKCVLRIWGLPTIGKTQTVVRAFQNYFNSEDPAIYPPSVIYFSRKDNKDSIQDILRSWRLKRGVVIIDDIDQDEHIRLSEIILHNESKLSLITIGEDGDDLDSKMTNLEKNASDELTKILLPTASEQIRRQIAHSSDGFPSLIKEISELYKQDPSTSPNNIPHSLLKRILGKRYTRMFMQYKLLN